MYILYLLDINVYNKRIRHSSIQGGQDGTVENNLLALARDTVFETLVWLSKVASQ